MGEAFGAIASFEDREFARQLLDAEDPLSFHDIDAGGGRSIDEGAVAREGRALGEDGLEPFLRVAARDRLVVCLRDGDEGVFS